MNPIDTATADVVAALPEGLRGAFVVLPAPYGLAVEHNDVYAAQNHREEQLHAAELALGAAFNAYRLGDRIEVYGRKAPASSLAASPASSRAREAA